MTPVDTSSVNTELPAITDSHSSQRHIVRQASTVNVDEITQTRHGSVSVKPGLHIPGESGEYGSSPSISAIFSTDDIPEEERKQLQSLINEMAVKKLKFKMIFTIAIASMLVLCFAATSFPWFLPYYHTVVFPLLYLIRIIVYSKANMLPFCLDFCYFTNVLLIVFCWAYPLSQVFFAVTFGAAMGPVAVAAILFRNSMVYHDYDRMTSSYIHLMPVLIVYIIRWFPEQTSKNWYFYPNSTFAETSMYTNIDSLTTDYLPVWVEASWLWIVAVPLIWFIIHTIFTMFIESCLFSDDKYVTSFRWISTHSRSLPNKILTLCGKITSKRKMKLAWFLYSVAYSSVSILSARLVFQYFVAHSIYAAILFLVVIYNGASFYIDVFAIKGLQEMDN